MKLIPLTRGLFTKVDDEDYEWLNQWKWNACANKKTFYAVRTIRLESGKRVRVAMHRLILGITDPNIHGDHKDINTLNNQRSNLRPCTNKENRRNRKSLDKSTSKYLGVHAINMKKTYMTKRGLVTNEKMKYVSKIKTSIKEITLGRFDYTPEGEILAAKAYDTAARIHHGEFANLNFKD